MSEDPTVEIHFHNSEMVVAPARKAFNHRKLARKISADVRSALGQPRTICLTGVIIDMCHVRSISSAGINELIHLRTAARAAGVSVRLQSLSETVADVIRLTRLERIFDIDGQSAKFSDDTSEADSTENERRDSFVSA